MKNNEVMLARLERIEYRLRGMSNRPVNAPRVLITGGTGTLGEALTTRMLADGYQVSVLSRDAHRQSAFSQKYPLVRCFLADICDYDAVLRACSGQDIVIHAAALKQVDYGEFAIDEFSRVNITGTEVVARAADMAGVARALFISSDKAVQPLNFYGVTKAVGERIWLDHNNRDGSSAMFSAVRYGNVAGSNGSVLQVWRKRLASGQPIIVRSPDTTRFFMTVQDALVMVELALEHMRGGEIFVPTMTPAFALHDLALAVVPDRDKWITMPLGPREKQHEVLIAPGEYWENAGYGLYRIWPMRAGSFEVPVYACSSAAIRLSGTEVIQILDRLNGA